jgi:hypothetical protein
MTAHRLKCSHPLEDVQPLRLLVGLAGPACGQGAGDNAAGDASGAQGAGDGAGDKGSVVSRSTRNAESAATGLGRRRRPCGQLNDFIRGFNAVIHGYPD